MPPRPDQRESQSPIPASNLFYPNLKRKVKVVVVVDDFLSAPYREQDKHQATPSDIFQEGPDGAALTHWAYDYVQCDEFALLKQTFPGQIFREDKQVNANGDVGVYFVEWVSSLRFEIPTPLIPAQLAVTIGFLHNEMVELRFLPYAKFVEAVTGRDLPMLDTLENVVDAVVGGADLTVDYL